jgi:hypothetical protein
MPRYAELIYNGMWFTPEREALQSLIDKTQEFVTGGFGGALGGRDWTKAGIRCPTQLGVCNQQYAVCLAGRVEGSLACQAKGCRVAGA